MIAPLAKFIDWSVLQIACAMLPQSTWRHSVNETDLKLEQAVQFLNRPDFIPAESQPAQLEFKPANKSTVGPAYYWSVQAVDSAFAGSPFAAEGSFKVLSPAVSVVEAHVTDQPPGDFSGDGVTPTPCYSKRLMSSQEYRIGAP
jgi:hypothetical protein